MHRNGDRLLHRDRRAGKSRDPHHQDAQQQARNREIPALSRGARHSQERKGHQREDNRVQRRENAVVEFGTKLTRRLDVQGIIGHRRDQLRRQPLRHVVGDTLRAARELGHVEGIALEGDQRRLALADLEPLQVTVFQNDERTAVVLDDGAVIGHDVDPLGGVTLVVDEHADQHAAGTALLNAQGELAQLDELPGLDHVRQHVGP